MKILVCPLQSAGHMNSLIGLAQALRERDYQIYFAIDPGNVDKIKKFGFEEVVLQRTSEKLGKTYQTTENPIKYFAEVIQKIGLLTNLSPKEKLEEMLTKGNMYEVMLEKTIEEELQIKGVIEKVQPDLVLVDNMLILPCILYGKAPWVYIWSGQPLLMYNSKKLPPFGSGKLEYYNY